MVTLRWATFATALFAAAMVCHCGGGTAPSGEDASAEASSDAGTEDLDAWWRRFDALPFEDAQVLPRTGEVPPAYPGACWNQGGICGVVGACDDGSGWCCRGMILVDVCKCGATLGCSNSEVCCKTYVGALEPKCLPFAKCPGYETYDY